MGADAESPKWDDIPWDNENEDEGAVAEIPKALKRGFYGALESAGAAGEMFGIDAGEDLKDWAGEKARNPAIARPARLQEGTVVDHPERLIDPEWWVSIVGENLPNLVGMMIPGAAGYKGARLLGMGYKAAKTAGLVGGATGSFTLESGAAYKDAKEEMLKMGYDEDRADQVATIEGLVVGTVNSLLEMAPFNALLSNPGGKKLLGRVIRQAWLEGGTEAVQENVNMLAARYGHDTDLTWKDQVGRTIESGLAGAVLGGPTGLFAGVDQSDNKPPPPNVIPTVEKSLGLSPTGLASPNIEVVGKEKTDLPQMMPEPKSAEESAQVFAQGLRPAVESYEVFEQAGMTKPEEQIARERNQQVIDSTNIDAENEIDRNEMIRRQYAQEFEKRRFEAERMAKEQQSANRQQEAERGLKDLGVLPDEQDVELELPEQEPLEISQERQQKEAARKLTPLQEQAIEAERKIKEADRFGIKIDPAQKSELESVIAAAKRKQAPRPEVDYTGLRPVGVWAEPQSPDDLATPEAQEPRQAENFQRTEDQPPVSTTPRGDGAEGLNISQTAKSEPQAEKQLAVEPQPVVKESLTVEATATPDDQHSSAPAPMANDDLKKISDTGLIQMADYGAADAPLNIFPVADRKILERNGLVYTDVETGSQMVQTDGLWKERDRRSQEDRKKRDAPKSINDEISETESILDTLEKRMARTIQNILDENSLKELKNQDRIDTLEKTYERDLGRHRTLFEKLEKLRAAKKMQKGRKADQPRVEAVTAPAPAEASKPTLNEDGRRSDGKPILPGDQFLTATGRETTPYPKYSTKKSFKRDDVAAAEWTKENYRFEAESRGDDYNVTLANAIDPKNFTQADGASAMLYIFGDTDLKKKQPQFLKPLVDKPPTLPADQRTMDKPAEMADSGQRQPKPIPPSTWPAGKKGLPGAEALIQREEIAIKRFVEAVQEQFGKTHEEAIRVYERFQKDKLVKIDRIMGQFDLKDGRVWEQSVIDEAAKPVAPKPEKPAPKPKKQGTGPQTMRGRIKQMGGINFGNFKGELKVMPTAVKFLTKKSGVPIDLVERTLRDEGWIGPEENLLEILNSPDVLKRGPIYASDTAPQTKHQQAQQAKFDEQSVYEPEAPPDGEYVTMKAEDLPEGTKLTIIDSRTLDGWDEYEVIDKDPFWITLKDGTTVELKPLDKVQVLAKDLEKAPKSAQVEPKQPAQPAKQATKDATKAVQSTIDENEEPSLFDAPETNTPPKAPKPKKSESDQEQEQLFGYNQKSMFDAEGKVKQAVAGAMVDVQRIQGGKKYAMKVPATEAMQEVADNKTAINRLKSMLDCL